MLILVRARSWHGRIMGAVGFESVLGPARDDARLLYDTLPSLRVPACVHRQGRVSVRAHGCYALETVTRCQRTRAAVRAVMSTFHTGDTRKRREPTA